MLFPQPSGSPIEEQRKHGVLVKGETEDGVVRVSERDGCLCQRLSGKGIIKRKLSASPSAKCFPNRGASEAWSTRERGDRSYWYLTYCNSLKH